MIFLSCFFFLERSAFFQTADAVYELGVCTFGPAPVKATGLKRDQMIGARVTLVAVDSSLSSLGSGSVGWTFEHSRGHEGKSQLTANFLAGEISCQRRQNIQDKSTYSFPAFTSGTYRWS